MLDNIPQKAEKKARVHLAAGRKINFVTLTPT